MHDTFDRDGVPAAQRHKVEWRGVGRALAEKSPEKPHAVKLAELAQKTR
jgi:hypothetical protein